MSAPFLTSLDLLSISTPAHSLHAHDRTEENHCHARVRSRECTNFYLSSSTLPSKIELMLDQPADPAGAMSNMQPQVTTVDGGSYPGPHPGRTNAVALSTTADYHDSLLLDQQQQHEERRRQRQKQRAHQQTRPSSPDTSPILRQWLPLTKSKRCCAQSRNRGGECTSGGGKAKKRERRDDGRTDQGEAIRDMAASLPQPHLTRQEVEEFEALPIAVRRKVSHMRHEP
ncbi:hypothetical protein F5Y15DRAFT_206402 [Xylariaceae sp. FL0016]|nr:hypothetical protein F5Y15DRAFT_206402 [Xylariaceae sp. FL0016]